MSKPPKQGGSGISDVEHRHKADEKREERQEHKDRMEIVRAIDRIPDQLAADEKQQEAEERKRRQREWATIVLLFCTAGFALAGDVIFYRTMMDGRDAERPIIGVTEQTKAPKFQDGHTTWDVSFTNYGKTPAFHERFQLFVKIGNGKFECDSRNCTASPASVMSPGQRHWATASPNETFSADDLTRMANTDNSFTVYFRFTYLDGFGTSYVNPICLTYEAGGNAAPCDDQYSDSDLPL